MVSIGGLIGVNLKAIVTQKYPKRMVEVFKVPNLPKRLLDTPPKKEALA